MIFFSNLMTKKFSQVNFHVVKIGSMYKNLKNFIHHVHRPTSRSSTHLLTNGGCGIQRSEMAPKCHSYFGLFDFLLVSRGLPNDPLEPLLR